MPARHRAATAVSPHSGAGLAPRNRHAHRNPDARCNVPVRLSLRACLYLISFAAVFFAVFKVMANIIAASQHEAANFP
jgi:hypothetical protein